MLGWSTGVWYGVCFRVRIGVIALVIVRSALSAKVARVRVQGEDMNHIQLSRPCLGPRVRVREWRLGP